MRKNLTSYIYWCLSGLLAGVYFFIVYRNTVNVPQYDDFGVLLKFLSEFIQSTSFSERFGLIAAQHNEHRLVLTRLITLLCYCITGKVSLSALIVISNLFLLGIGVLFLTLVKSKKHAPLAMLLIVALLFNGQNFSTSTWAMAGIANVGTLLLAMLAVCLVSQSAASTRCFAAGVALSVLAIFSNGNGIFLFPSLSLSLLLQKRKKELAWFALLTGAATACYFFGYKPSANQTSLLDMMLTVHVPMVNFFSFIGCNLWLPSLKLIPLLCGVFIFLTYVLAFYTKYYKKNMAWFSFFTFMLLTAAAVAINRPDDEMGPLRYRIYGCMFPLLAAVFYVDNKALLHLKYLQLIAPPIVAFSMFCTLLYYGRAQAAAEFQKVSTYSWQHGKNGLVNFTSSTPRILAEAEALRVYAMPKIPLSEMALAPEAGGEKWQDLSSPIRCHVDYVTEQDGFVLIRGWAYHEATTMNFMRTSLWLLGSGKEVKVHPYAERRYDMISDNAKVSSGFFAVIPKSEVPPGTYELGVELQRRYIIWNVETFSKSMGVKVAL
jgi:hypothetical protein